MVKLSGLVVDASKLDQACEISFFRLRSVTRLTVSGKHGDSTFSESLKTLLKLLPTLEYVNLREFIPSNSHYLTILANAGLPLKVLILDNTISACDNIDALIRSLVSTLEAVDFGAIRRINTVTLHLFASTCHRVVELNATCSGITTQGFISPLGSNWLPLLVHLNLRPAAETDWVAVNDEMALAILRHHPYLVSLITEKGSSVSTSVCAEAITLCPYFEEFRTREICYLVQKRNKSSRCAKITLSRFGVVNAQSSDKLAKSLMKIFNCSQNPVEDLSFVQPLMENEDICTVLSAIGKRLRILCCTFIGTDRDDDTMEQVARMCPRLESIQLHNSIHISDRSLTAIANHCHSLIHFNILKSAMITDVGVCRFLAKIGERLKTVRLHCCGQITNASLLPIVAHCSQLTELAPMRHSPFR